MKTMLKYETPCMDYTYLAIEQMFCQSQGTEEETLGGIGHDPLKEIEYIW